MDAPTEDDVINLPSLPVELIIKIFTFLRLNDIFQCLQVSRRMSTLSSTQELWRPICDVFYGSQCPLNAFQEIKTRYDEDHRWSLGRYDIPKKENRKMAYRQRSACFFLDPNHVLWGAVDGSLGVRDLDDNPVGERIMPHSSIVWEIQRVGDRIYTNSNKNPTIGIFEITKDYNLHTVALLHVPQGSQNIWDCTVTSQYIIGGDGIGTIFIWDVGTFQLLRSFNCCPRDMGIFETSHGIFSMDVCGETIVVGTTNGALACFDFLGNKTHALQTSQSPRAIIRGVKTIDNGLVIVAEQSGWVRCWDIHHMTILWEFHVTHNSTTYALNEISVDRHHLLVTGISVDHIWIKVFNFHQIGETICQLSIPRATERVYSIHGIADKIAVAAGKGFIIQLQDPPKTPEQTEQPSKCIVS